MVWWRKRKVGYKSPFAAHVKAEGIKSYMVNSRPKFKDKKYFDVVATAGKTNWLSPY